MERSFFGFAGASFAALGFAALSAGCSDAPQATTGGAGAGGTTTTSETGGTASGTDSTGSTSSGVPCAGVSKGPWALHVDATSAVVRWEACEPGLSPTLRLTPEGGGAETEVTAVESPFEVTETL